MDSETKIKYEDLTPEEVQEYREKRERFYMYLNHYDFWKSFTDQQRGKAIMAIFNYELFGELPTLSENDNDDIAISPYLNFWMNQAQKDFKKYVNTSLKNKINGAKSHSNVEREEERTVARATERYQTLPNDSEGKRTEPDKIRQDKIKGATERYRTEPDKTRQDKIRQDKTRNNPVYYSYIERATDSSKPQMIPPTYNEVFQFCEESGIPPQGTTEFDAEEFIKYYSSHNWEIDGNEITDWKPLIDLWINEHQTA